jgi:DUF4097 and DUF4098 domain-containing protein YvlB
MKTTILTLSAAVLLSGCVVYVGKGHAKDLLHQERTLSLDAATLQQLSANTGAGKLDIIGEENRTAIELVAHIYYYDADDIRLSLQSRGDTAVLDATFASGMHYGNSPYIDMVVKVPARFGLSLNDGSGDTDIRGLRGNLDIEDGSGDLHIDGGANATVEDGSGSLVISQLSGQLRLDDGSGDITISHVTGDVSIDDGSGEILVSAVGGMVTIDDGSGDINVNGAGGLKILNGGSGALKINAINGPVHIND